MSDVVVASNLAVKWVIEQPYTTEALALLREWAVAEVSLIAPQLFTYELTNTFYKYLHTQQISLHEAQRLLDDLLGIVTVVDQDPLGASRALEVSYQLDRPAAYDGIYVALAESQGCPFWTANEKFYNAVHDVLPFVNWIGNQPAAGGGRR
jgi:predicted nucleic acid-binding protein